MTQTKLSNVDSKKLAYKERMVRLETERRERSEDIKELCVEMKGGGMSKDEIAGVKLAVRRTFETEDKRLSRITAEEVADSLGGFADLPLGVAAIARAREDA